MTRRLLNISELTCSECNEAFFSAAELLKHFALHVIEVNVKNLENKKNKPLNKRIPELHPIRSGLQKTDTQLSARNNIEEHVGSAVNPMKFCVVTMEEKEDGDVQVPKSSSQKQKSTTRKYECSVCLRCFGWSTDLKRHILTHTGERPFHCAHCDSSFTRNFLLQKHNLKQHSDIKTRIPALKPIASVVKQKSRKQDKFKIKRKPIETLKTCQIDKDCYEVTTQISCTN